MKDCIFCQIIEGKIKSSKVYEDKMVLAFYDAYPIAEKHVLVIPKKHIESLNSLKKEDYEIINAITFTIPKIAQLLGLKDGYKTLVNTGPLGGQTVFHLHYHIIGGKIYKSSFLSDT